jgi:DNA-binding PucR family transcriptional regulator
LCGGNITDTAKKLGLHRNSLIYRINRIREAVTCNLDDMQDRKMLLLSFLFEGEWEY